MNVIEIHTLVAIKVSKQAQGDPHKRVSTSSQVLLRSVWWQLSRVDPELHDKKAHTPKRRRHVAAKRGVS